MAKIYLIHDDSDWTAQLIHEMQTLALPHEVWTLDRGILDLTQAPPEGVFFNCLSAARPPELARTVLAWLEEHGRQVVNGSRTLLLERSKFALYAELARHGLQTPRTVMAMSREDLLQAGAFFDGAPFVVRYRLAGGGPETRLFSSREELEGWVASQECPEPGDGLWLVQRHVRPLFPVTVRVEFVGGKFLYAAESSSEGKSVRIVEEFWDPILGRYEELLADNKISIAGIEFVRSRTGEIVTYDVSTNSRYDAAAEAAAGMYGMRAVAGFLGSQLAKIRWA